MRLCIICLWGVAAACSCKNRAPTVHSHILTRDSINSKLDFEDSTLTFLDSLQDDDPNLVSTGIINSTYKNYRKGLPFPGGHLRNNLLVRPQIRDSLIRALPDTLVSRKIFLVNGLLSRALFLWQMGKTPVPDSLKNQSVLRSIKYAWGSKEYLKPYNPFQMMKETESPSPCNEDIFGLDCSGFIFQLFKLNDIVFPEGNADLQRRAAVIRKSLEPYFGHSNRLTVKVYKQLSVDSIQSGDIVYFYSRTDTASHIGIALSVQNRLDLFHCSGARTSCGYNVGKDGGIRCVDIGQYIKSRSNVVCYGVARIVITGEK